MKVELCISKARVPYIVKGIGEDRVTVSDYSEDQLKVEFELTSQLDILYVFHAGISYGFDQMKPAFLK